MDSTERENVNYYYEFSDVDSYEFIGTNSDPDTPVSDINSLTEDSDSEDMIVSYFTGSLRILQLTETHQRTADSHKVFDRFVEFFHHDDFWEGTRIVTKGVSERMKSRSYVPLHEFLEGIREQGTQVLKKDILDRDRIVTRSTETVDTVPLYFSPLFKMMGEDLLALLDFAESVDFFLTPMTYNVCKVEMFDTSYFKGSETRFVEYYNREEFHECLENLDSLIDRLQNCQDHMLVEFRYLFQGKGKLRELIYLPDEGMSSEKVIEHLRLLDFCNHALTLYMKSVLQTMEVMNSLLLTATKLLSFQSIRLRG